MLDKININIKKTLLAFIICLVAIPLARFISPQTIIDGNLIYIAWLPISVMFSVIFIFGRYAIAPLILAFAITNSFLIKLTLPQAFILLFCQLFAVFVSCAILRLLVGKRWRCGPTAKHMGARIFWGGFFAPVLLKITMYLAGQYFAFPLAITSYFGSMPLIYTVIDIQSLISAALIFTTFLYYPMRMIISPRYARRFWQQECLPWLAPQYRSFTLYWFIALAVILTLLCAPYQSEFIAGYLVPVIFIVYFIGISRIGHALLRISWSVSAFLLVVYNKNFLQGGQSEYSLSFVLSVLISFTICLFYMADIYARSDRNKRRWRSQAEEDPLTGLPNLRALESHLQSCPQQAICSLRIDNLDFLSRHYGLMMGVDCKRQIIRALQPLLGAADKVFQVPGSELILVLDGPEPSSRLNHMVAVLNHKKFSWHNQPLDLEFNLSQRFDMLVLETLFSMLHKHPGQRFSVNLLPATLMQKNSAGQIIALFQRYSVSPELITIEVTEEQAFSNADTSRQNLEALRAFGCAIAIDDFGTGYANYERLKHLQADIIKIDGCFVRDILTDPLDAIMVKSIVEMARAKQMSVVAEYVESEPQKARLLELGVNYLQGYLIGKPQPLGE
ncbi:sensor domain-containing phosphodiesterase [Klebsiella pneumoniae]|uniref:bifunctional diguanylate cyclase/phosphodiesterase n=1 Tax=Klebsiella pneumoniae TaxID=573 RepID=UPI00073534B7|nr:EAL domain-containing protein [Klebsiella pneumoniae]PNN42614.1 sensor domain-containing phosphodiesterase [Klebsiella pneumoniae]